MKQDYTMAYLRFKAGKREQIPSPSSYRRVKPDGSTKPLTASEGRRIRGRVDRLLEDISQ